MAQRIYLDHAATTPMRDEVVAAMLPYFSDVAYNASSVHAEGRAARAALDDARDRVARALNAKRTEIVFTASGSESDNLAILGAARALRDRGTHVVSSVIEHHAVLHALDVLRDEGFDVTLLPVDARGVVSVDEFERALRPDTILASIMYANNEIGTVEPIAALAAVARARNVVFHTDAVQAPGYLPLDVRALGVDLLSLAAHKFYGPKGVGILYARAGLPLRSLVVGGSQEFGKRAGTENVAAAVGAALALELAERDRLAGAAAVGALRDAFEADLRARIPGLRVNGLGAERLPNNLSIAIPGGDAEAILMQLDLAGVAASSGSACTSGAIEPSHVAAALGLRPAEWAVVRFTLGRSTTADELRRAAALVPT
jgi:cysteine desulfurase